MAAYRKGEQRFSAPLTRASPALNTLPPRTFLFKDSLARPSRPGAVSPRSNDMRDLNVAPVRLEVLRDQSSVAVMGFVLAAEEAPLCDQSGIDFLLDLASAHQIKEFLLIYGPVTLVLLVLVKNVLSSPPTETRC